jgi:hypothetical protein
MAMYSFSNTAPRVLVNTRAVPSVKAERIPRTDSETDVSESSRSLETKDFNRKSYRSSIRSNGSLSGSEHNPIKGRLLARESGFVPCKTELCLTMLSCRKRRHFFQRNSMNVAALDGNKLFQYAGGARVHMTGDCSFTVRNCHGMPAIKCWGDRKVAVIYGTRPVFAGTKAVHREAATNFYPWLQLRRLNDGTVSVKPYQSQQPLWYSVLTLQSESITIHSVADHSVVATILKGTSCQVTISPGVDPAVMMCVALYSSIIGES